MKNQSELMRQHHAIKTGVSIGKEFTDLERQNYILKVNKLRELRMKYSIDEFRTVPKMAWYGEIQHIAEFEPMEKIYPKPIEPLPVPHDGVETIASVFGRKEKCYLPKKNIAI
ncbi:hypothetical protein UFOVP1106_17 [uncultured Caudovirales phage]|uniref:Uncharacterized protein n=1 Tax=uncultured Caudovirales phage TaxID=2100421 RepID=A0A6J5QS42_9CAUD|nr:hypothetical protein UFOVP1106_17 [uncultured Caudovirales phage]